MKRKYLIAAWCLGVAALGLRLAVKGTRQNGAVRVAAVSEMPPAVRASALDSESGLKEVTLKQGKLTVAIHVTQTCGAGDWDAIRLDLEHSENDRLLLALEPVGGGEAPRGAGAQPITLDEITSGTEREFSLPEETRGQFALVLCKDTRRTGSCHGKPYADVNAIFSQYATQSEDETEMKIAPAPSPDRIYFYQYVVLHGNKAAVLASAVPAPAVFRRIERHVSAMLGATPVEVHDRLAEVRQVTSALRSLSLDTTIAGAVRIALPRYTDEVCPAN